MLRVVDSFEDAADLMAWASSQPFLALDSETSGVNVYEPGFKVRIVQFGSVREAWIVILDRWRGLVQEIINKARRLVIHNAAFDIPALREVGIIVPWHKTDDTMIAMRIAQPNQPAALKEVGRRLVSRSAADSQVALHQAMRKNKWGWDTIPIDFPPYLFYAAMDVILTSRVADHRICQEGFNSPIYGMEMDVRSICSTMEMNGFRVNVPFCEQERDALIDEIDGLKAFYSEHYSLNLGSNKEIANELLTRGAPLRHRTPSGSVSVTKDALEEARLDSPPVAIEMIDHVLRLRKIQKLKSTYYENFIGMSHDGLLHPSIETCAAKTGRQSIRAPALQTLPRGDDDPDAMRVREAVIPRNEGDVLLTCDYSQIELRLIASFSGDKDLQEAFRVSDETGTDFFTATMRDVYGDPTIPKTDPRRTGVKTLWYSSSYGAGIRKMAASAKIPEDEMRSISAAVFKRYPGAKALMKRCELEAKAGDDWITTPAGRRVWVDPEFGYKALNAKVQATAADIFKRSVVQLAHAGLEEFFVVPVHDEVVFSLPPDIVDDVKPLIRDAMTCMDFDVPLPADPSDPGDTWASIKK